MMFNRSKEQEKKEAKKEKICSFRFRIVLVSFSRLYDDVAIAIDPSFISKSGRLTYGMGRFWSGVAQRVKRGLEIMAIGAISLSRHTCVMLGAIQSPDFRTLESEQNMSMLDWYIFLVRSKASELLSLTDILVADAFFSKYEFVNAMIR